MSHLKRNNTSAASSNNSNFVRASYQTQNRNNFTNKLKTDNIKPEFKVQGNDFPELIPIQISSNNNITIDMDFKAVTLLEKEVIKPDRDEVKPGWVRLYYKNNESIIENIGWEYGQGSIRFHQTHEEPFNEHALRIINQMLQNWENYKIEYNNLYGEDAYEKLYGFYKSEDDDEETYSDEDF